MCVGRKNDKLTNTVPGPGSTRNDNLKWIDMMLSGTLVPKCFRFVGWKMASDLNDMCSK